MSEKVSQPKWLRAELCSHLKDMGSLSDLNSDLTEHIHRKDGLVRRKIHHIGKHWKRMFVVANQAVPQGAWASLPNDTCMCVYTRMCLCV